MRLDKRRLNHEERLGLLEDSVFKTNNSTSIFEDIETKIFEYEANIRSEMVKLNGDFLV